MLTITENKPEIIWRNGERWSLSDDKSRYIRLLDLAPHLEARWMKDHQEIVHRASEGYNSPNKEKWHSECNCRPIEFEEGTRHHVDCATRHQPTGLTDPFTKRVDKTPEIN